MNDQSFNLLIERYEASWRVKASCSLFGEVTNNIDFPFTISEWQNTFAGVVRSTREIDLESLGESSKDLQEQIKTLGSELFKAVFSGEIGEKFSNSLAIAKRDNFELHLNLRLEPELNGFPWEYLYDAKEGFIALSERTPLLRYLEVGQPVKSLEVKPPFQVLVIIAIPKGLPSLNVEKEWQGLQMAVEDLEKHSLLELTRLEKPTLQELHNELSLKGKEYHILHFIGHGDFDKGMQQGVLAFEDENRNKHLVSSEKFETVLKSHESLRLVFLNACKGAVTTESNVFSGVAQNLVEGVGIPAVIAMQFAITDAAAITLAKSFYKGLTVRKSVASALASARIAINASKANELEWSTPILFMRSLNSYLFDIQELSEAERQERVATLWAKVKTIADPDKEQIKKVEKKLETISHLDPQNEKAEEELKKLRDRQNFFTEGKASFEKNFYKEALEYFYKVSEIGGNYQGAFDFIALAEESLEGFPPTPPLEQHFEDVIESLLDGKVVFFLGLDINPAQRPPNAKWQSTQGNHLPSCEELAAYFATNNAEGNFSLAKVTQDFAITKSYGPLRDKLDKLYKKSYSSRPIHHFFVNLSKELNEKAFESKHPIIFTTRGCLEINIPPKNQAFRLKFELSIAF